MYLEFVESDAGSMGVNALKADRDKWCSVKLMKIKTLVVVFPVFEKLVFYHAVSS